MSLWRQVFPLLLLPLLAGCEESFLAPAGPVTRSERTILFDSLAIMLAIVVPTIVATLAVAYWFRASNTRARYSPDFVYSGRIELIVWSIPALVIFFLGGIAWIGSHELDPARPLAATTKPLEVDVVSLDWKWLFIYPHEGVASINRLVLPAGAPVHLNITSASVFNVFFVPRLASEIYAMNGMVTQLNFEASEPGTYPGLSFHFSGDGFSDMNFETVAMTPARFAAWVRAAKKNGATLDGNSYRALLKQTAHVVPYTYRKVSPRLFEAIARDQMPTGDGPLEIRDGTGAPSRSEP